MINYILKGQTPVKCEDIHTWGQWMTDGDCKVGRSQKGELLVSTVFLGLDHNFGEGKPLLFETMIFTGEHDGYQERYSTWEEAVEGHKKACELAGIPE